MTIRKGSLVRIRRGGKVYVVSHVQQRPDGINLAWLRQPFLSNTKERHPDAAKRAPYTFRGYVIDTLIEVTT